MDDVDGLLIDAWWRVVEKLKRDPKAAATRFMRTKLDTYRRPTRHWCLALRANDRRLNPMRCYIEPREAIERQAEHTLTLEGDVISELNRPVQIAWPGVHHLDAAGRLGLSDRMIYGWIRQGYLHVSRWERAQTLGQRGKAVPLVFTRGPVLPAAGPNRRQHPLWGSLWAHIYKKIPTAFAQTLVREPRYRQWRGKTVFRGWRWRCPGRRDPAGGFIGCGKLVNMVYSPVDVWTLPRALGGAPTLTLPNGGTWTPGADEPHVGERSFACQDCWRMHQPSYQSARQVWGDFVMRISSGVLYGRDVPRPRWKRHEEKSALRPCRPCAE